MTAWLKQLSTGRKVLLGVTIVFGLAIAVGAFFPKEPENNEYKPQNEFKLDPWIELKFGPIDMSLNKAVLYLFLASAFTVWTMTYIARRMQERPNRIQTAVEAAYQLMKTIVAIVAAAARKR